MSWYQPFLYPFALTYSGITHLRNRLFELGVFKQTTAPLLTLIIGNLSVGGTGKTPMVEFLIKKLRDEHDIAVLSRGYGRKTSGYFQADASHGPNEIGDEPFQIYHRFAEKIPVYVGEDRIAAIKQIVASNKTVDVLLLDDAFQHRSLKGDLNILLTTFQKPFFDDYILPMGRLRESCKGAKRADFIIVTKTPAAVSEQKKQAYIQEISKYSKAPIFFSGLKYGKPRNVSNSNIKLGKQVILLSGIADDSQLYDYVKTNFHIIDRLKYPDHYSYKESDLKKIKELVVKHPEAVVLTTEKDAVKLKKLLSHKYLAEIPIFALPIQIAIADMDTEILFQHIEKLKTEKFKVGEI